MRSYILHFNVQPYVAQEKTNYIDTLILKILLPLKNVGIKRIDCAAEAIEKPHLITAAVHESQRGISNNPGKLRGVIIKFLAYGRSFFFLT